MLLKHHFTWYISWYIIHLVFISIPYPRQVYDKQRKSISQWRFVCALCVMSCFEIVPCEEIFCAKFFFYCRKPWWWPVVNTSLISQSWENVSSFNFLANTLCIYIYINIYIWKRFIDDIFFICTDTEENLDKFLEDLNKFHPHLRFTYEKSREKISFLDIVIKIKEGKITSNLYCKPTDDHQYLHYDSCHAEHIKRSMVFSQTLQLKRICSEKRDLDSNVENLSEWFRKRGYPEQLIKNQVDRALQFASNNSANRSKQEKETGIPLVTTYHPRLKDLSSFIKRNF